MTIHALIAAIKAQGATIALKGDQLVLRHGKNVPECLLVALKAHRAELLMLLTCGALFTDTMALHDDYHWRDVEERLENRGKP